jgi:DNA-binding transcriptional LysR family regulator
MVRLDAVTLRQLRALSAVADTGSIAAAAERLGLTPSAVHAQIRNLEGALEVTVLQRMPSSSGSQPSWEAQPILEAAQRIEIALQHCVDQIAALKSGQTGRVVLGVVSTAKYFAPRLIAMLKRIAPQVEVVLHVANREGILADLDRLAVDLAIMGRPPRQPVVEATLIGPHPHGLIAPPDHALVGSVVDAERLLSEPLIAREEGSGTRILMMRYLESVAPGRSFRLSVMGSNETIKQAVMAGLGLAFISLHTVTDEIRQGRLVALDAPGLPLVRQWFLVYPQKIALSPAASAIHDRIVALEGCFLPELPQD